MLAKIALLAPRVVYVNSVFGAFRKYEGTKTESPQATERSQFERSLLRERYQQRMWPEPGLQWQLHRLIHHGRILKNWGWKALIRRLGERFERMGQEHYILQ